MTTAAIITTAGRAAMLGGLVLLAGGAQACEPIVYTGSGAAYDTPIEIGADCSFQDRWIERRGLSPDFSLADRSGAPVVDLGKGRVGQKIMNDGACGHDEKLLFVDCTTGESLLVEGLPDPSLGSDLNWHSYIKFIQPPHGKVRVGPEATVVDVAASAREMNLDVVLDARAFLEGKRKRDRYDVACGCKLYYPGSPGAR